MTSQNSDAVEMAPECNSRHSNAMRLTHTGRANVPCPSLTPLHPRRDHDRIAAGAARGGDRRPPRGDHQRFAAGPAGAARRVTRLLPRRGYSRISTGASHRRPPSHPPPVAPRPPPDRRRRRLPSRPPPPCRYEYGIAAGAAHRAARRPPAVTNTESPPAPPNESPATAPVLSALPPYVKGQKRGRPVLNAPFPRLEQKGDPATSLKTYRIIPISS